jgi:CHASE3 domain sensor protein
MKHALTISLLVPAVLVSGCEKVTEETAKVVTPLTQAVAEELAKPIQKSTRDYADQLKAQEQERLSKLAEEQARIDALPNGPRRK